MISEVVSDFSMFWSAVLFNNSPGRPMRLLRFAESRLEFGSFLNLGSWILDLRPLAPRVSQSSTTGRHDLPPAIAPLGFAVGAAAGVDSPFQPASPSVHAVGGHDVSALGHAQIHPIRPASAVPHSAVPRFRGAWIDPRN